MTTTTNRPDVQLPAGAHVLADCQEWPDSAHRQIQTDALGLSGTSVLVSVTATQLRDGCIDAAGEVNDGPLVWVDESKDAMTLERLTVTVRGARELARTLVEAADTVDGWLAT